MNDLLPMPETWGMLPSNWSMSGRTMSNGVYSIAIQTGDAVTCSWIGEEKALPNHLCHACTIEFDVPAESEITLDLAFGRGAGRRLSMKLRERGGRQPGGANSLRPRAILRRTLRPTARCTCTLSPRSCR